MKLTNRQLIQVAVLTGCVQVAAYWISGMMASPDGAFPIAQPDSLLYLQAADRIVEGFPFSFSEGALPSTGTTSVLYPFVLAIPRLFGFAGDTLSAAGFWLNALFYLVFLWGWSVAVCRWIGDERSRLLAVILLALSGQAAYSALSQSDIGVWMALSGFLLASLANGWRIRFAVALVIAPWIRPEGMFCILALGLVALLKPRGRGKTADLAVALTAFGSALGVFALNYHLTGAAQFASVAHKGYFIEYPFAAAVHRTFTDAVAMVQSVFLSLSSEMPRSGWSVPLLGGVAFLTGVFTHDWREHLFEKLVWTISLGLGFASVAQSGWQGTNMDRYLAWLLPIVAVFTAEGAIKISDYVRAPLAGRLISSALVLYALVGAFVCVSIFNRFSSASDELRQFGKACAGVVPEKSVIAANGGCGIAYYLPGRRLAHLSGMYSPEYEFMRLGERMDDLKRNPTKRFDYWILNEEFQELRASAIGESVFGRCVLTGHGAYGLYHADWTAFDAAETLSCKSDIAGLGFAGRLDVGYPPDEQSSHYMVCDRYGRPAANPFFLAAKRTDGTLIADVGRVIVGGDAFDVSVTPGRDLVVVMRQAPRGASTVDTGTVIHTVNGSVGETLSMNVSVNGKIVSRITLGCDQEFFSEVAFVIPGAALSSDKIRLGLLGDHIPFGYWFYQ